MTGDPEALGNKGARYVEPQMLDHPCVGGHAPKTFCCPPKIDERLQLRVGEGVYNGAYLFVARAARRVRVRVRGYVLAP